MPEALRRPTAFGCLRAEFVPLRPEHLYGYTPQPRQRLQYGLDPQGMDWSDAEAIAAQDAAWAMVRGGTVLACLGINETFPGAQGTAWAFIGEGIGADHLALTRFARDVVIGASPLRRIEAIVRCVDLEPFPSASKPQELLDYALNLPTPEVRWARAVGLSPVCVLRAFGAAGETHMLLERLQ